MNINKKTRILVLCIGVSLFAPAQTFMMNPYSRKNSELLKGKWNVVTNKPLIMSEFGGEAQYGQHGKTDTPSSWSEENQEKLYRDNLIMFKNISNLCGTVPWILFDFRSPNRWNKQNQDGWNRKGFVSDKGQRKKAWYVIKTYYEGK
jgi:beta-glucuronidase